MLHKALFEESEQSYAYGKHNLAALQEGGFYATRKIKLKNKYKRNSASEKVILLAVGFRLLIFFI